MSWADPNDPDWWEKAPWYQKGLLGVVGLITATIMALAGRYKK